MLQVYGWCDKWCAQLNENAVAIQKNGCRQAIWNTLGQVLPQALGPLSVLVSVGVDVLLGGKVELVKLVTASSVKLGAPPNRCTRATAADSVCVFLWQ